MEASVIVNCDGAAFDDGPATELARILRDLAKRIEDEGPDAADLFDVNGNKVGAFNIRA